MSFNLFADNKISNGSNGDKDMHDSIPNQVDLSEVKGSNKENPIQIQASIKLILHQMF